jgi:hypothetical protein
VNVSGVVFWILVVAAIACAVMFVGLIGVVLAAGQDLPTEERDDLGRWR